MAGINIPILLSALSQKNNDIVKIFNRMRSAGSNGLQEITN
jgi:hypothetical protein